MTFRRSRICMYTAMAPMRTKVGHLPQLEHVGILPLVPSAAKKERFDSSSRPYFRRTGWRVSAPDGLLGVVLSPPLSNGSIFRSSAPSPCYTYLLWGSHTP